MSKISIVGIGPGAPQYVTPAALEKVKNSDVIVGGRRNLELFRDLDKETYEYQSGMEEMLAYINQVSEQKKVAVIVSGDPGFYSLLDFFLKRMDKERLEVIPGISSFQYLFAKLAKPWKNYSLCSLHGRELDLIESLQEKGALFLLTDRSHNPGAIARILQEAGMADCTITVGENLSYEEERIFTGNPDEIEKQMFSDLCVVVIEKNGMEL